MYHVKLQKYSVLLTTMKILLVYRTICDYPDSVDDLATLTSCNGVEKQGFLSSTPHVCRITCPSLDSMLQYRTAIFCCVAEGCLVLCLRNCILDKFFPQV